MPNRCRNVFLFFAVCASTLFVSCSCQKLVQKLKAKKQSQTQNTSADRVEELIQCFNMSYKLVEGAKHDFLQDLHRSESLCKTGHVYPENFAFGFQPYVGISTLYQITPQREWPDFCLRISQPNPQFSAEINQTIEKSKPYAEVFSTLAGLSSQAHNYFEQENYKDDACQKGREMYRRFMDLTGRFDALKVEFSESLEYVERQQKLQRLATLEKEEKISANWHLLNVSLQADKLADSYNERNNLFDLAQFKSQYAHFEEAYISLEDYLTAHPEVEKERHPASVQRRAAQRFFVGMKKLNRELQTKNEASAEEIKTFLDDYNSYIDSLNLASRLSR